MTVEEIYIQAAQNRHLVELEDADGKARVVEPYMVHVSTTGDHLFHCYQLSGFSRSHTEEPAGWRNPKAESFTAARELSVAFRPRKGYNPYNRKFFPKVIFTLPKPVRLAEPHPV